MKIILIILLLFFISSAFAFLSDRELNELNELLPKSCEGVDLKEIYYGSCADPNTLVAHQISPVICKDAPHFIEIISCNKVLFDGMEIPEPEKTKKYFLFENLNINIEFVSISIISITGIGIFIYLVLKRRRHKIKT